MRKRRKRKVDARGIEILKINNKSVILEKFLNRLTGKRKKKKNVLL